MKGGKKQGLEYPFPTASVLGKNLPNFSGLKNTPEDPSTPIT